MEQQRVSNMPTGTCEKIFKALNITPAFRAMRRIAYWPQSPTPERAAARPLPAADPAAKVHPKTKLVPLQPPNSVVPIIFESSVHPTPNEKEELVVNVTAQPKGEMAEQEKKVAGQAVNATESKVNAEQSHGEGANTGPKVETKAPSNKVKPVPKVETVTPAKPLVEQGQQKVATRDNSREQGNKSVPNSSDRFTDFINSSRIKIRATSDVGKNRSGPDGTKIKTKASSNVGSGKSFSFKNKRA